MKIVYLFLGVFTLIFLIVLLYLYSLSGTTWGGWEPPSTALILDKKERAWVREIERHYQCKINYIGLDGAYMNDSIIYITIEYKEHSVLNRALNDEIEEITGYISSSFLDASSTKGKQKQIQITFDYIHNFNNDEIIYNTPLKRKCLYNIRVGKVLSMKKKLLIPKFKYFDFSKENSGLLNFRIGDKMYAYFNYWYENDSLSKYYSINHGVFNSLDSCVTYTSKYPDKIKILNGYIESYHKYVFCENQCVSVTINYRCFPKNKDIHYSDMFAKVTGISKERITHSPVDKLKLIDGLKKSSYKYYGKMFGVSISLKGDTLRQPWTIEYETSLDEINFYKTLPD